MFGIGLLELVVIAVLGILVVGPEKVPDLARQAANALKAAKRASESVRDELRENLGPDYADLELSDLHPRSLVRKHVLDALTDEDPDENDQDDQNDQTTANHLSERHVS